METHDWQALTQLTGGQALLVERVRLAASQVAIEGRFELPPLARLNAEDQIFVAAFVRCHGSIKQMEKYFGVSYPTIKNRLNRIGARLPFVEVEPPPAELKPDAKADVKEDRPSTDELLTRLERGEASVDEVLSQLGRK